MTDAQIAVRIYAQELSRRAYAYSRMDLPARAELQESAARTSVAERQLRASDLDSDPDVGGEP